MILTRFLCAFCLLLLSCLSALAQEPTGRPLGAEALETEPGAEAGSPVTGPDISAQSFADMDQGLRLLLIASLLDSRKPRSVEFLTALLASQSADVRKDVGQSILNAGRQAEFIDTANLRRGLAADVDELRILGTISRNMGATYLRRRWMDGREVASLPPQTGPAVAEAQELSLPLALSRRTFDSHVAADRSGRGLLALGGLAQGAVSLNLLRMAANNEAKGDSFLLSTVTGMALGGGVALLLTADRNTEITTAQALWVHSAGGWALLSAGLFGAAISDGSSDDDGALASGVAFGLQMASLGAAWHTRKAMAKDPNQVVFMDTAGMVGLMGGSGLGLLSGASPQQSSAMALSGELLYLGWSATLGPSFQFDTADYPLFFYGNGLGTWTGAAVGDRLLGGYEGRNGGAFAGLALSFAASSGLVAAVTPEASDNTALFASSGMGALFGYGLASSLGSPDGSRREVSAVGGAWAGAGYFLLARQQYRRNSRGDLALIAFGTAAGAEHGYLWGRETRAGESHFPGYISLGAAGGFFGASVLSFATEPTVGEVNRAAGGMALGQLIGYGFGMLVPDLNGRGEYAGAMTLGLSSAVLAGTTLPEATFTEGDYLAVLGGGGWGLFQGSLVGYASGLEAEQLRGAKYLGLGLGLLSGEVFARSADRSVGNSLLVEFGSYSTSGLASGLFMIGRAGGTETAVAASVSSLAGRVGGSALAERLSFRQDDTWEYLFMQGWGAWQGLGWAYFADLSGRQQGGATLAGISLGFFAPLVWNQFGDLSIHQDFVVTGLALYGSWLGAWSAYVANGNVGRNEMAVPLLAGDVALLGGAGVLAAGSQQVKNTLYSASLGGLLGMGVGTGLVSVFSDSLRTIASGMLAGAGVGMLAGGVFGVVLFDEDDESDARQGSRSAGASGRGYERPGHLSLPMVAPYATFVPPPTGSSAPPAMVFGVTTAL